MNKNSSPTFLRKYDRLFLIALFLVSIVIISIGAFAQRLGLFGVAALSVGTSLLAGTLASAFDKAFGISNTVAQDSLKAFNDKGLIGFYASSRDTQDRDPQFPTIAEAAFIDLMRAFPN